MFKPLFEKMAGEHTDVFFMKVNVDELRKVMNKMAVRCMPTFCFFLNGKMKTKVEAGSSYEIEQAIKDFNNTSEEYLNRDLAAPDKFSVVISDEKHYTQMIANNSKVVVEYYTESCGLCSAVAPELSELASKHTDVKVLKVDCNEHHEIVGREHITQLPTFKVFFNGKLYKTVLRDFAEVKKIITNVHGKTSLPSATTSATKSAISSSTTKSTSPTKGRTTNTTVTKKPVSTSNVTKSPVKSRVGSTSSSKPIVRK